MSFYYRPTFITEWVRREVKNSELQGGYVSKKTINRLERLKGAFDIVKKQDDHAFIQWLKGLFLRDRILLPYVYDVAISDFQRKVLLEEIQSLAPKNRRIFNIMLDQCYSRNQFSLYWPIILDAYKNNKNIISNRWQEEKISYWDDLVESKQPFLQYVISKYDRKMMNLSELMNILQLQSSHLVYELLMIELFKEGTMQFYFDHEKRFREYFMGTNNATQQLIVSGYIKSKAFLKLHATNYLIIDKIGTFKSHPMLWSDIEKPIKKAFHNWKTRQHVIEFFEGVNRDHERFVYWEKFIPKMEDAVIIENNTILFYFSDVVIMEVLGTGAVYVYEISQFNERFGHLVEKHRKQQDSKDETLFAYQNRRPFVLKRSMLMDKEMVYKGGWLSHNANWQSSFNHYLKYRLNWEVNRHAIIQEAENTPFD